MNVGRTIEHEAPYGRRSRPPCAYLRLAAATLLQQDFPGAQATHARMGRVQAFRGLSHSHTPLGVTGAPCGRGFRFAVER